MTLLRGKKKDCLVLYACCLINIGLSLGCAPYRKDTLHHAAEAALSRAGYTAKGWVVEPEVHEVNQYYLLIAKEDNVTNDPMPFWLRDFIFILIDKDTGKTFLRRPD